MVHQDEEKVSSIQVHRSEAREKHKFDTPFFVIRNFGDIDQLTQFCQGSFYDSIDWGMDSTGSPLCRFGKSGSRRYPDRVGTVCVKRETMLEETKKVIDYWRKQ